MDRKKAIKILRSNKEELAWSFMCGECPTCDCNDCELNQALELAIEALETPEEKHGIDWESIEKKKILKARKGKYVIYDVDYFLKHLNHEIYILEHERLERSRREKEEKE